MAFVRGLYRFIASALIVGGTTLVIVLLSWIPIKVRGVPMARNCLGRARRDRGQKRVPEAPAMMTA